MKSASQTRFRAFSPFSHLKAALTTLCLFFTLLIIGCCENGFLPNVFTPVFYGYQDFTTADGAPGKMRVFYPSLEGSPANAPILDCGNYPLVMFLHGNCSETNHYLDWLHIGIQLSCSGYIVAFPELPCTQTGCYPWDDTNPDKDLVIEEREWLLNSSSLATHLQSVEKSAIGGHSYGALLAANIYEEVGAGAYFSLGGTWTDWFDATNPLKSIEDPSLFALGTGDFSAGISPTQWADVGFPKHKLELANGTHWDFLPHGTAGCDAQVSTCSCDYQLYRDYLTLFLSKYLPPNTLKTAIPSSLAYTQPVLTADQHFYAGGHHMTAVRFLCPCSGCTLTHSWEENAAATGKVTYCKP